jgi:hypothetical protein
VPRMPTVVTLAFVNFRIEDWVGTTPRTQMRRVRLAPVTNCYCIDVSSMNRAQHSPVQYRQRRLCACSRTAERDHEVSSSCASDQQCSANRLSFPEACICVCASAVVGAAGENVVDCAHFTCVGSDRLETLSNVGIDVCLLSAVRRAALLLAYSSDDAVRRVRRVTPLAGPAGWSANCN